MSLCFIASIQPFNPTGVCYIYVFPLKERHSYTAMSGSYIHIQAHTRDLSPLLLPSVNMLHSLATAFQTFEISEQKHKIILALQSYSILPFFWSQINL